MLNCFSKIPLLPPRIDLQRTMGKSITNLRFYHLRLERRLRNIKKRFILTLQMLKSCKDSLCYRMLDWKTSAEDRLRRLAAAECWTNRHSAHDDSKRQSCVLKSIAELQGVEINTAVKFKSRAVETSFILSFPVSAYAVYVSCERGELCCISNSE